MGARALMHTAALKLLPDSGATGPEVRISSAWPTASGSTTGLVIMEERPRRRVLAPPVWRGAIRALTVAALPLAEAYDPPRRRLDTVVSHVIVLGDAISSDVYVEPESMLTVTPRRATLWLPTDYRVPILRRRKSFISSLELADEGE